MTIETRTTIEPSDVVAIEFECAECKHRITRNLKNWLNDPKKCDNCGSLWTGGDAMQRVKELYSLIRYFSEMAINHPFTVRLGIKNTEVSKPSIPQTSSGQQ